MSAANGYAGRIGHLREVMREHGVAACVVPSADPHLSEYLPEHWQARRWLCGFDGSAGTLVVTTDAAGLWVDSRYCELAERQLVGSGVAMMPLPPSRAPVWIDWLCARLPQGAVLAIDGGVLALDAHAHLRAATQRHGLRLRIDLDLPGDIWQQRPPLPTAPVRMLPPTLQGHTRRERLAWLRERMHAHGAQWHLISALDDIAWLLGLRGSDVPYNPVFLAHLLLGPERAWLCMEAAKLDGDTLCALAEDGIDVLPYTARDAAMARIPPGQRLLLDPARTAAGSLAALAVGVEQVHATSPCQLLKSIKRDAEITSIRRTMEQDGAALCVFFAWLEQALAEGGTSELEIDARLLAARAQRADFIGPSFATIAGFAANAAMPHYRATPEHHARIEGDGLLLIDSGGQYLGGTTDITRMVAVGMPTDAQKRDCSLVLKGMIALSSARFPVGTRAPMLDAIARAPLWREGLDYGHGTGHGVGCFLNVHEGPQSISFRAEAHADSEMKAGMVTSIEPGVYRPGQWGVRWENLVHTRPSDAHAGFLDFETLTLCPIDMRCLDPALLAADEIDWLDHYHARVRERLLPHVDGDAARWLLARTGPMRADQAMDA